MSETAAKCPYSGASLPGDGTPLHASPTFAEWRKEGPTHPLEYQDGHEGLIALQYDLARAILEDSRFSMKPDRMPVGPEVHLEDGEDLTMAALPFELPGPLDEDGQMSEAANLLVLDGEEHSRLRRIVTGSFSLKKVRARRDWIVDMVAAQVETVKKLERPIDVWVDYALPIAAKTHCKVIGIPDSHYETFVALFEGKSTAQQKYDFIREVLKLRANNPDEDAISDLLASNEINQQELEGVLRLLLSAGRDSVAYLIATASVALLSNPDQLELLRNQPELINGAMEEFMRMGSMFITVFPRTATEDVEIMGVKIKAGTSVSVSPVSANRDPSHWENPEEFDVTRDAFGHLGFSHGIHGCIGQQLARIEITEGISQLIQGLPGLRLIEAEQLKPMHFAHPVAVYEAGSVFVEWDK